MSLPLKQAEPRKFDLSLRMLAVSLLLGALYLVFRAPLIGHTLTWDEAMNLLGLRSFLEGSDNEYSFWLWRHPPLYMIYLLVSSSEFFPVWALRAVLMNLALGGAVLVALYTLMRDLWGKPAALASVLMYILLPGTIFFDVWIKRDLMTNFFGLLFLLMLVKKRWIPAGVMMGLALLTKELAVVYLLPLGAACLVHREIFSLKKAAVVLGVAAGLSFWWYIFVSDTLVHYFSFATGIQLVETESWHRDGLYFWKLLPVNLGWTGSVFAVCGLILLVIHRPDMKSRIIKFWPLILLLPYFLVLTVVKGKTPWMIVPALPAFAALMGIGFAGIWNRYSRGPARYFRVFLGALVGLMIWEAAAIDYENMLKQQDPGLAWGTLASTKAADLMNKKVGEGETFAVSPFNYWTEQPGVICPILLTRLQHWPDQRWPNYETTEALQRQLNVTGMDWVLLSPHPSEAEALLRPLKEKGAVFFILEGSILMDARNMKREATNDEL